MVLKFKSDVEKFITFNFPKKTKLVLMAQELTCTAESDYQWVHVLCQISKL